MHDATSLRPSPRRSLNPRRLLSLLIAGLTLSVSGGLQAATITVTKLQDGGPGSLRQALQIAAVGDVVDFAVNGTIVLTMGPLLINKSLSVTGPGSKLLTIDAQGNSQVMLLALGNTVDISGVTLKGGNSTNCAGFDNAATLTLSNVIVSDMVADDDGANCNSGDLTIVDSVFEDNCSHILGGALWTEAGGSVTIVDSTFDQNDGGFGGALASYGDVAIYDSSFTGNVAWTGGALNSITGSVWIEGSAFEDNTAGTGGAIYKGALAENLEVWDSVFVNNATSANGGALANFGGLMLVARSSIVDNLASGFGGGAHNGGTLYLLSSTVSGNTSLGGGGGGINSDTRADFLAMSSTISGNDSSFQGGGVRVASGTAMLFSTTVADNYAPVAATGVWGSVDLKNTIVSGPPRVSACTGVSSLGFNLASDSSCALNAPSDLPNTDPQLGPLQNNGGPTQTHAIDPATSPATDAADDISCLPSDQRGTPRPQGRGCDIGAYEAFVPGYGG